ncbi:MAG: cation:dicarboxylase symporter family transporter [Acidobacteria bacterium]|nr:cation:dicarboxylase symporter family transporter [Acidobacteriota bacterium]
MDPSADVTPASKKRITLTVATLAALFTGLTLGIIIHRWQSPQILRLTQGLELIGVAWTNALRITILPLIATTLIYNFATRGGTRFAGKVSGLSLLIFILLLSTAAVYTLAAAPALISQFPAIQLTAKVGGSGAATAAPLEQTERFSLKSFVNGLIPANLIRAAADGEIIPIILASVVFGFALARVRDESRKVLLGVIHALLETVLIVVKWLLRLMPLAVFAFGLSAAANFGWDAPGVIGYLVVIVCTLLAGFTLLLYPIVRVFGGVGIKSFARAAAPGQMAALATRSSIASLPALLTGAEKHLRSSPVITNLVLPLAVSTFKINRPISGICKFLFLAQVYGVPINSSAVLLFSVSTLLLSFSTPGIPSGGPLVSMPLYLAAGIPVEGVILLKSVDSIADYFKTVLNVSGDTAALTIIARLAGPEPSEPGVLLDAQHIEGRAA